MSRKRRNNHQAVIPTTESDGQASVAVGESPQEIIDASEYVSVPGGHPIQSLDANPLLDDPLMSYSEVGRRCGKSHQTIMRLVAEGVVKAVWLPSNGGTRRMGIRTSEALKLIQRLEEVKGAT